MKLIKNLVTSTLLAAAIFSPIAHADTDGFWTTPAISGYGKIHYLPDSQFKPQADHVYKVVFSLTQAPKNPADVNPALDHVARTVNLYVAAGVPVSNLHFVAVAYGAATPLALDDEHYRSTFGVPNPNLALLAKLRDAGVTVSVCGQAVAEHNFKYEWISHRVELALSGLTTITTLESQGYVLMPL